jgi:hypothetical protein
LSTREGTVPQWEFKLNGALASAQNWNLKGHPRCRLKVGKKIYTNHLTDMDLRDITYAHSKFGTQHSTIIHNEAELPY